MPQMEEKEMVTIEFDDGDTAEYFIEGVVEAKGNEYIVLIPKNDGDSMEFYRVEEHDNDEEDWIPIEDEEEYKAVIAELRECGYEIEIEN